MATKSSFISPVAPGARISGEFDAWSVYWKPWATSGPNKGKGQHKGLDFAVPIGTPVRATRDGTITRVATAAGSGLLVQIDHGKDVWTGYHHLASSLVKPGQKVTAGDRIALSGNSGTNTTGAHLHLGTRDLRLAGETRFDPRPFADTPFLDIGPDHWGFAAAKWAEELGLVAGVGGELGREEPLTMIRFLTVLHRLNQREVK